MKMVHRNRNFETNESNYTMIGFELIRKDQREINSDSVVKEMFPDWSKIKPGNWSARRLEIGLHRSIYDGRYTLEIFHGDDVIFCADVYETR